MLRVLQSFHGLLKLLGQLGELMLRDLKEVRLPVGML
jgi:hypothetical protein